MAFARCGSSVTPKVSGTFTISQLGSWIVEAADPVDTPTNIPRITASLSAFEGSVGYSFDTLEQDPPPEPQHTGWWVQIIGSAGVPGKADATGTSNVAYGIIDASGGSPFLEELTVPSETQSYDAEITKGPIYPYKNRGSGLQPVDLDNPCHPQHLWVAYAWGTKGASGTDTYNVVADSELSDNTSDGATLTATVTYTDGVPDEGSGTSDLGWVTVTITCGPTSTEQDSITGEVASWTNLKYTVGAEWRTLDLTGFSETSNGVTVTGGSGSLTMSITDASSIPGGGVSFDAEVAVPVIVVYDLVGYDWDTEYSGMEFTIASDDGLSTKDVETSYSATVTYTNNDWDSLSQRIWSVSPSVASAWATTAGEIVDPSDASCTIEERDLTDTTTDLLWDGWELRRKPSVSVQAPDGAIPSNWVADDPNALHVTNSGLTTEIVVEPSATSNSVRRTLLEDLLSYRLTVAGMNAIGLPTAYQKTLHTAGDDVWCWENYAFLKLSVSCTEAQTLTIRLQNSTITFTDDHKTGSERITNLYSSLSVSTAEHSWEFSVSGTGATEEVFIDLTVPSDPRLAHVDWIEIDGFTGEDAAFTFTIEDIELQAYNPTTTAESGHTDLTVVFTRPDSAGLPVHYVSGTLTADGSRAVQIPDDTLTLFSQFGLRSLSYIRGRVSGDIGDALFNLSYWWGLMENQEGFECSGTVAPTSNGQADYDASFVDSDGNDMLGGNMLTADVREMFDQTIDTSASVWTEVPCGVRCGTVFLASGIPIACRVRKHIRASEHGTLRRGGGRVGSGQTVTLWEYDGASWTQVGTTTSDAWSRYSFSTGGREADHTLRAIAGSTAPTDGSLQGYNELRRWRIVTALGGPDMCRDLVGRRWYVMNGSSGTVQVYSRDTDTSAAEYRGSPFGSLYLSQAIEVRDDGAILVGATDGTGTALSEARQFVDAETDGTLSWQALSVAAPAIGEECEDFCRDLFGRRWAVTTAENGIVRVWHQDLDTGAWIFSGAPFGLSYYRGRAICVLDDGRILAAADALGATKIAVGYVFAEADVSAELTWEIVATVQPLGNDLQLCAFDHRNGLTACAGYFEGVIYVEQSTDGGQTQQRLDNGEGAPVYRVEVCAANEVRAPIALRDDGTMEVSPTVAGVMATYVGDVYNGFTNVTA